MRPNKLSAAILSLSLLATASPVLSNENTKSDSSADQNIELSTKAAQTIRVGKIEGALLINTHLNNFEIDVDVTKDQATLSGEVNSSAEKDLAGEIAKSIEGINSVDNKLAVIDEKPSKGYDQAATAIKDATITTAVKMKLLTNSNISGIDVSVETKDSAVTLAGNVSSSIESDLAEKIASNVDDVKSVNNNLEVNPS